MALVGVGVLSACSRGLLTPDYSKHLCHFAVVDKGDAAPPQDTQGMSRAQDAIGGAIGTLPYSMVVPPLLPLGALIAIPLAALFEAGTG